MRILSMFIIGLVLTSCVTLRKGKSTGNTFQSIINEYRTKNEVRPLRWNHDLYKVTEESTDEIVKTIDSKTSKDTSETMTSRFRTFRRINLTSNDGEIKILKYIDGNKFDSLQTNLFEDPSLPRLIKSLSPKTYRNLSTTISIGSQIGKNTYNVHSNVCEGTYDYNGTTVRVQLINGNKVLWTDKDSNFKNRSISCLKLDCLDDITKNQVKMYYFLNQIIKTPKLRSKLLDENYKTMSFKRIIDDSYILFVMNIQ